MPREPIFTTANLTFLLVAATSGKGSQEHADLSSSLETRIGAVPRNYTAMRVWVNGYYNTTGVVTTPVNGAYSIGAGVFTEDIDDTNFSDLAQHEGSWMLHDSRRLTEVAGGTAGLFTPLLPDGVPGGSMLHLDTRSKRKLSRTNEKLFLVLQKSQVTEENINISMSVTVMWLLP